MNVLVIPEDFRKDEYILRPIMQAMFTAMGRPRAKILICKDPLLGGIDQATSLDVLQDIIERYPMVNCFVLVVDRDGDANRKQALSNLETKIRETLAVSRIFVAEHAWQELEVWALAGQDLPGQPWAEVRADPHPKEMYFEPLAAQMGITNEPGQGRKTLGREAAARYSRVRQLCPELADLEGRVAGLIAGLP